MSSTVAILGAGGFLGTNLALRLAGTVGELRCFGRRQAFPTAWQGLNWTRGEVSGAEVRQVLAGCDTVIHLASTSTPATADRRIADDAQSNVIDTLELLDQCVELGVGRIVFISSGGTVYGPCDQIPTPESTPTNPITAYGVAKLAIEKYLAVYRHQHGLDYRILRVANPFGPYQTAYKGQGVIAAVMASALHDTSLQIWGDGGVVRDYVYVNDVVEAIIKTIGHTGDSRVFNIGSGIGHDVLQVVRAVEKLSGKTLQLEFRPARPVDVPVSILDSSLATRELGWRCATSFEAGLTITLEWARAFEAKQACQL
ncbi:MAG: NAD-dependent epimerase/dehydratase family protein [Sulfuritalea sp.]|nr:NAD-dependent epimerase/dehydratase family protein [Sulfuritalea sp.]